MKVIFLDVDGVLIRNKNKLIEKEKINLLRKIVKSTDSKIVLNSSYKKYKSKNNDGNNPYYILSDILNEYGMSIYDITPVIDKKPLTSGIDEETGLKIIDISYDPYTTRAGAVYKWLNTHKDVESFVILDDVLSYYDYFGFTDNFIQTDANIGLTEKEVDAAIEVLNDKLKKTR